MATKAEIDLYAKKHLPDAKTAAARYSLNKWAILTQGALESGYGTSNLARNHHAYFGVTVGSGKTNEFYQGDSHTNTSNGLVFRAYSNDLNSFMDYARLISSNYVLAAAKGDDVAGYFTTLANSKY